MKSGSIDYPAGALVRTGEICRDTKTGRPGLLPINRGTWYKWIAAGHVPAGRQLGPNTVAWPIEVVLAIGQGEPASPEGDTPAPANRGRRAAAKASVDPMGKNFGPVHGPNAGGGLRGVPV